MSLTFEDLKQRLQMLDELTLLELFNISSEELVELLGDKIEERFEELEGMFDDDNSN